jgi:hypothetical protein
MKFKIHDRVKLIQGARLQDTRIFQVIAQYHAGQVPYLIVVDEKHGSERLSDDILDAKEDCFTPVTIWDEMKERCLK